MPNQFDDPKQLISHARDEIKAAETIVAQFSRSQQYTPVVYVNQQTGEQIYRVQVRGPSLPPKLANIVKDAAGNLRDSLDHAVYSAAVMLVGGSPQDTGFPFAKDAAGVAGELGSKRLSGNPPEIRPVLAAFGPHEGGNDTLWTLNQIRNPNTHRFIIPTGTAAIFGGLGFGPGGISAGSRIGYSYWDAARNEIEYMRLGPGSNIQHQVNATLQVVFEGIKPVAGKLVIPTLNLMSKESERIVTVIETETLRILAARRVGH